MKSRLMRGALTFNPTDLPNLAAWYDVSDASSFKMDTSNRVSLLSDKSGNSAVNCLVLNGATGNYASSPDSAALDIVGDIDLRTQVALADWTPGIAMVLLSKFVGSGNQRSWSLRIETSGAILYQWSTTGADQLAAASTANPSVSDLGTIWIRVTHDVNNGAGGNTVTFFTSADGLTWTQLGAAVVAAGTTSIFNSISPVEVGSRGAGTDLPMVGRSLRAQIYNGIDGTLVFDANFALAAKLATSFKESSSNAATVTINTSGATGARISGERDLYQGTVANQPVYLPYSGTKYAYLNGVAGNYLSAPDSAALSITGDIDLRCELAMNDWTPVAFTIILAKDDTGSVISYYLAVNTTGTLVLMLSQDGSTPVSANSSVATSFSDGMKGWIRATWRTSDGRVQFFTSVDGNTWNQLGTDQTIALASIFNSTGTLNLGARANGTSGPLAGNIYRAQIYNGINGTLAFDFNPATYTTGSTLLDSSANAATITINGGAMIVTAPALYFDGSNDYLKAPPFSLSQPETIQFIGQQMTWTANDNIYDGNAAANRMSLYQQSSSPNLINYAGTNGAPNAGLALKTRGLLSSVFNAASSALRVNKGTLATGSAETQNGSGFVLAAGFNGTVPSNITTNEIAIYSSAQTLAELNRFADYIGKKWSITL